MPSQFSLEEMEKKQYLNEAVHLSSPLEAGVKIHCLSFILKLAQSNPYKHWTNDFDRINNTYISKLRLRVKSRNIYLCKLFDFLVFLFKIIFYMLIYNGVLFIYEYKNDLYIHICFSLIYSYFFFLLLSICNYGFY